MTTEGIRLHSALDRQRLQQLPVTLRRHALAAWESTASAECIHRVITWTRTQPPRLSESNRLLLLPICFVHLDPALIPSGEWLEGLENADLATQTERELLRAIAALQLFVAIASVPEDSGPWLWSRLWGWFHFIDTHFELLSAAGLRIALAANGEHSRGMNALVFVDSTKRFSRLPEAIGAEGVKEVIGRALSRLFPTKDLDNNFTALNSALLILFPLVYHDLDNPQSLAEFLDGVGGRGRLAEIIIPLLRRLVDDTLSIGEQLRLSLIRCIARMVQTTDASYLDIPRSGPNLLAPPRRLSQKLLRHDIVPLLVQAVAYMSHDTSPSEFKVETHANCVHLLMRLLSTTIGAGWIDQALDVGLLDALIQSSKNGYFAGNDINCVRVVFAGILPQALAYHHTVASLRSAIPRVQSHLQSSDFMASPFGTILNAFIGVAQQYFLVIERMRGPEAAMRRACDNLACPTVDLRNTVKCCSSCRAAYYCTKACQTADWKAGHRAICYRYTSWTPVRALETILVSQDRTFLRSLLQKCYEDEFTSILTKTVAFLSHQGAPNAAPFVVLFGLGSLPLTEHDWTAPGVQPRPVLSIAVFSPLEDALVEQLHPSAAWSAVVRRAQDSEGRMVLHLTKLNWSSQSRYVLVPLRLGLASGLDSAVRELAVKVKRQQEEREQEEERTCDEMIAVGVKEIRERWWNERGIH
ncbi:hypothetical protein C8F01DRAFT_319549 [Mycena amicta]|nr:hypothetical protein C8F01DRAFT_319549 [Mycena amicta]